MALIRRAQERGCTSIDNAGNRGFGRKRRLVGEAVHPLRDRVVPAAEFGNIRATRGWPALDGGGEPALRACEASLERLGVEVIHLAAPDRVDPSVPFVETVGAMEELEPAVEVRFPGLSEAAPGTIRRARPVHPISGVRSEWPLGTRDTEAEALPTCGGLGIGFVASGPLGRGFRSAGVERAGGLGRAEHPCFPPENREGDRRLLDPSRDLAAVDGCTPAGPALARLPAPRPHIVPMPGTREAERLDENLAPTTPAASADEVAMFRAAFPPAIEARVSRGAARPGRASSRPRPEGAPPISCRPVPDPRPPRLRSARAFSPRYPRAPSGAAAGRRCSRCPPRSCRRSV